jgi:hypothetical protein
MFNADSTEYTSRRHEVARTPRYQMGAMVVQLDTHRPIVHRVDDGGDSYPACTSDRCRQSRAKCPTPIACRLPEDPEDVHRWPLAWIAAGFVMGALDSPMARVLLALLGVPALMFLASLTATLVR